MTGLTSSVCPYDKPVTNMTGVERFTFLVWSASIYATVPSSMRLFEPSGRKATVMIVVHTAVRLLFFLVPLCRVFFYSSPVVVVVVVVLLLLLLLLPSGIMRLVLAMPCSESHASLKRRV